MNITRRQLERIIKEEMESLEEEDYDCIRDCLKSGYSRRECRDQCGDSTSHDRHPLDVDGDGKLTVSEMKISRRQLGKTIKEELNEVDSSWIADTVADLLPGSLGPRPGGGLSPLGNLAEDIFSLIENLTGNVDMDFGEAPMTEKDIIEFLIATLNKRLGVAGKMTR